MYYQVSFFDAIEAIEIFHKTVYVRFFFMYFEYVGEVEKMSTKNKYYLKSK